MTSIPNSASKGLADAMQPVGERMGKRDENLLRLAETAMGIEDLRGVGRIWRQDCIRQHSHHAAAKESETMQAMTEFFDYIRYDVVVSVSDLREEEAPYGRYVLAVDAICRGAVLQGRIRQLERQLADARRQA